LSLPNETVDFVHLVYRSLRPTFFSNQRVDLLAEGFNIFRIVKELVQYLRDSLLACYDKNLRYRWRRDIITCRRRRTYGGKIDHEQSPCDAFDGPLHTSGLAHEPHKHIVLWIGRGILIREMPDTMI
jgi:hypothetical protein